MKAKVYVTLKKGVLDPQGKAVLGALDTLGFREIKDLRMGKFMEIELEAATKDEAKKRVKEMCEKLLANIVMEDFKVEVEG
ncbi:MAG TPA: phosphoribosylformylglycinamidine synthase subunit PurS [Thermodesulfobacteriota bacterium]|nr:phosphoribosylformylglycinamidine synthase subunit PurS [Thermodesulfobacteriota bacterium]